MVIIDALVEGKRKGKGEGTRRRLIGARNPISLLKVWKYSILVKVCV